MWQTHHTDDRPDGSLPPKAHMASTLPDLIAQAASWHAKARAVVDVRRSLTYEQLMAMAEAVAGRLCRAGVRRGDRVAVAADKRVETVAAMLGVMRAGAAFVPVDVSSPEPRVRFLLEDSRPRAVIGPFLGPPSSPCVAFSLEEAVALTESGEERVPDLAPDDIAYCMYTSGSSGTPKGVRIHHGAVLAFVAAVHELMRVEAASRCLNTSPFFFDVSVVDVWYPLTRGATVHLTEHFLVPDRVLDRIEHEAITHFSAVGSILSLLRRGTRRLRDRNLSSVTHVMTGAEIVDPATVNEWLDAMPGATIFNGYGPTEATCCCFAHPITIANRNQVPYPIGRPFPGTTVAVIGEDGEACARGVVGELLLSGAQVTPGYLGRPEEDLHRFVERDGRRWYRTGDLVVCDNEGVFHFRGRRDHELKVRGYRIHPAEITAALHGCQGIADVHVTTARDDRGQRTLVAAVVLSADASLDEGMLRSELRARLPDYMVPRRIQVVSALPMLPSGKVDDGRVAALFESRPDSGEAC